MKDEVDQTSEFDRAVADARPDAHIYAKVFGDLAADSGLDDPWRLLAAVFSFHMRAENPDEPFGPMATFGDRRSAIPTDLSNANLVVLRDIAKASRNPHIRARIYDVLWVVERDRLSAEAAVDAYLEAGQALEDPRHWVGGMRCYQRAARIALSLGKKSPRVTKVADLLLERVRAYRGGDPLYFTAKALDLLLLLRLGDVRELMGYANEAARRARESGDMWRAQTYYDVAGQLARRAGDQDENRKIAIARAEIWVAEAEHREAQGEFLVSREFWENAVQSFRPLGMKKEAEAAHRRMKTAGDRARQNMKRIGGEIDLSEPAKWASDNVSGLSGEQAFCRFALLLGFPEPDELRKNVLKEAEDFPLHGLMPASIVNDKGEKIAAVPGLISAEGPEQEAGIRQRMVQAAVQNFSLNALGVIRPATATIMKEHSPTDDLVAAFVCQSAFVPPGRAEFWALGLAAGFRGDFITALHVLMPQFEHALRQILHDLKVITTSLDAAGIEEEWALGRLLSTPELAKVFPESVLFAWRAVLVEKAGPNLRNLLLHGVLEPSACRSAIGWFFWWMMLHFVVRFSTQMQGYVEARRKAVPQSDRSDNGADAPLGQPPSS